MRTEEDKRMDREGLELWNKLNKENAPTKERKIIPKSVEDKRAELEILKIEREMERLSKPDIPETNYFKEMLEQQKQHFAQLLEMNKQQNDLRLEIEKLKMIGESESSSDMGLEALEIIKPFLPQIAAKLGGGSSPHPPLTAPLTQEIPPQEMKGGDKMEISTTKEFEEYKLKIKSGEIDEKQAYEDFKENVPPHIVKTLGYKGFKKEFDKIKNS
jgi:hypothetical protein